MNKLAQTCSTGNVILWLAPDNPAHYTRATRCLNFKRFLHHVRALGAIRVYLEDMRDFMRIGAKQISYLLRPVYINSQIERVSFEKLGAKSGQRLKGHSMHIAHHL